jgi:two-component system response regulator
MNREAMNGKPVEVLLVDDDPQDVDLTLEVMEMAKVRLSISVVGDGKEAIAYLKKEGDYSNVKRPDLILLDLNMPKMNGHEVLTQLKNDDDLKSIPVVVLTTSSAQEDIASTYNGGANCYVTKPVGLDEFQKVVEAVENFWFTVVKFPVNA